MYSRITTVKNKNGLHIRLAAMLVNKAAELSKKYNTTLYIRRPKMEIPFAFSILAVISLKILENEEVEICSKSNDNNSKMAVRQLIFFIDNEFGENEEALSGIDEILAENNIAKEQLIESVPIGVVVTDPYCNIVDINGYALNILAVKKDDVLGKSIADVNKSSELNEVLKNNNIQKWKVEYINSHIVFVSRCPIMNKDLVIGGIETYQDISELVGMKELNEKFNKILETSHDLISFIDENGKITYVNPAYKNYYKVVDNQILNKNLLDIFPNQLEISVFNNRKPIEDFLYKKGDVEALFTIHPIYIEGSFKGIISIAKPVNELREYMSKLEESKEELDYYKEELRRQSPLGEAFSSIIGQSQSLRECLYIAEKASKSTSTVLIRGESGTGKELIAKAIHENSDRCDKPFVRINCAAIPENLLESELFGYEKGSFTDAYKSKPGKFQIADGGTIFLDEIGDMSPSMQVKILRVLQEREFERIGGLKPIKVDVRVIAATNRNLEDMVEKGGFRNDLYYRLNVIGVILPPLKKRKEDINLLVEHFINKLSHKFNMDLPIIENQALKLLREYDYPGNIRELENILERAIAMSEGGIIRDKDLPIYINNVKEENHGLINMYNDEMLPFQEYDKEIIRLAMKKYGSFNKAGKALGLTHRTISLKCRKYDIK
ncbi:MAG: sigma 54-interacting transcriptional regulator [Clostridiaceae bacterium]